MAKTIALQDVEFNQVKAKTKNQFLLVKTILEKDVTIVNGPAGTGKTLVSLGLACKHLIEGKIDKILISRTVVPAGDIGFLPGNENEKVEPYLMGQLDYLFKILGKNYKRYIGENKIILRPLEVLRGTTFDNAFIILDEAQNISSSQIKLFLTRLGQNSKAIILGDLTQRDTNESGFRFCINFLNNIECCGIVNLTYEDILRNTKIGEVLRVFDKNGF